MYIDGYMYAVETDRKDEFIAYAKTCAEIFKKRGALRVMECWGDEVPDGKLTSMPMAVKLEPGETVMFSWCEWESKEQREAAIEAIHQDFMDADLGDMPFDGKRIIMGSFIPVVEV